MPNSIQNTWEDVLLQGWLLSLAPETFDGFRYQARGQCGPWLLARRKHPFTPGDRHRGAQNPGAVPTSADSRRLRAGGSIAPVPQPPEDLAFVRSLPPTGGRKLAPGKTRQLRAGSRMVMKRCPPRAQRTRKEADHRVGHPGTRRGPHCANRPCSLCRAGSTADNSPVPHTPPLPTRREPGQELVANAFCSHRITVALHAKNFYLATRCPKLSAENPGLGFQSLLRTFSGRFPKRGVAGNEGALRVTTCTSAFW